MEKPRPFWQRPHCECAGNTPRSRTSWQLSPPRNTPAFLVSSARDCLARWKAPLVGPKAVAHLVAYLVPHYRGNDDRCKVMTYPSKNDTEHATVLALNRLEHIVSCPPRAHSNHAPATHANARRDRSTGVNIGNRFTPVSFLKDPKADLHVAVSLDRATKSHLETHSPPSPPYIGVNTKPPFDPPPAVPAPPGGYVIVELAVPR